MKIDKSKYLYIKMVKNISSEFQIVKNKKMGFGIETKQLLNCYNTTSQ